MRTLLPALVLAAVSTALFAQQPPPRTTQPPAPIEEAAPAAASAPAQAATAQAAPAQFTPDQSIAKEIDIDQDCHAISDGRPLPDANICSVSNTRTSHHEESGTHITVAERSYVLNNTTQTRVAFLVHQPINDGWRIDSTPQPIEIDNGVAIFRAFADPGESVNLHIGERTEEATEQPQAEQPAAAPDPAIPAQEVNVDQNCRILVQDRAHETKQYSHPHFSQDDSVCHLESIHRTKLFEENLDNGVLKRTPFEVREATFVLQNITPDPVVFIVHQVIFHGGHIDSTPQPDSVDNGVAVFRVRARPGQTIHLHVGMRR
jgi:hypothetical protein